MLTGGTNRLDLWAAFAKRGMGSSASSPASNTTSGVIEAFDLPDDLGVSPVGEYLARGPVAGPFTPASTTYTLRNSGAAAINWTGATGHSLNTTINSFINTHRARH